MLFIGNLDWAEDATMFVTIEEAKGTVSIFLSGKYCKYWKYCKYVPQCYFFYIRSI